MYFYFVSQNLEKKSAHPSCNRVELVEETPPIEKRFYTSREARRDFTALALCFFVVFVSFLLVYTILYFL